MQVVFLTSHGAVLPSLDYFHCRHILKAVISPDKLSADIEQIAVFCAIRNIKFFKIDPRDVESSLLDLFGLFQPDLVFMCGFPHRITRVVCSYPPMGFFNVHFSLLPAYKGPDPIFWQIKNGEVMSGISIHHVEEKFDSGAIVAQQQIPFIPGETSGICNIRYSLITRQMLQQLVENITAGNPVKTIAVGETRESYFARPVADNLMIKWDVDTADEIENLVNACNPAAGGAITFYKRELIRLLEVSPVDATADSHILPGTIVGVDGSGIFVCCTDRNILRINILSLACGIITGSKLGALGAKKGDRFDNQPTTDQIIRQQLINSNIN